MSARFEFKQASDGQTYFNLVAANGEIVLTSERYASAAGARTGAASVLENAPQSQRYERRQAVDGQAYFVLKAANGEIVGTSEMYTTTAARDQGIDAVMRAAAGATLSD